MNLVKPTIPDAGPPKDWQNFPLKDGLPPSPPRIAKLPIARNGYPVPWFATWLNGQPEFRAVDPRKYELAIRAHKCWVCGQNRSVNGKSESAFVIGPMCSVNRISSEPPSHLECAEYAAKACPFLVKPQMHRRENDLPIDVRNQPVNMILRNPGCVAIWQSPFVVVRDPGRKSGGMLFQLGEPVSVTWWCEGRTATRQEVLDSVETGLPELVKLATTQAAQRTLSHMTRAANRYYPQEPPS